MGRHTFSRNIQLLAIFLANDQLCRAAYTLGIISPKNVMAKVAAKVTIPKIVSVGLRVPAISHIKKVEIVTTPTFTKLFMMRIVASKSLGFFSRSTILFSEASSDSRHRSRSSALSEKKATSEAEIIADMKSKTAMAKKPKI